MDLEFRHLRQLVAIADLGSTSGAADLLGIGPDELCRQLGRIEIHLGEPLFVRTVDSLTPTLRGREVLELARDVLSGMGELMVRSRRHGRPVRLVGPEFLIAPVATRLGATRPPTPVDVRVMEAQTAVGAVHADSADVAVTFRWPHLAWQSPTADGIKARQVDRVSLQVLLPDTHPLAGHHVIDLAKLASEAWCVRVERHLRGAVVSECGRHGFEPDLRYRLDSDDAVEKMVASGQAVALVTPAPSRRTGTVSKPYHDAGSAALVLVWRAGAVSPDLARRLIAATADWNATRGWATHAGADRSAVGSPARPVRIGSVTDVAVIPAVPRLRTVHGLHAEIVFGTRSELLTALRGGQVDLVQYQRLLLEPDVLSTEFARRTVVEDEDVVVALAASHRLLAAALPLESLVDAEWAVRAASDEAELLHVLCSAAGYEPRIASTYTDPRQVAAGMASGRLIRLADSVDPGPGIVRRRIVHPVARRTITVLWQRAGDAASLADLVTEELRLARTPYGAPYPDAWTDNTS